MPLDNLPGKLVLLTRNQRRDKNLRNYSNRNPGASTKPGTTPFLDASVLADATDPHQQNAVIIANGVSRATATGTALDEDAQELGTFRQPPVGGSGAVIISASAGGTTIFAGDVVTHDPTSLKFQCLATATYPDGAQVPIQGIDTGPGTNLPAGTILRWQTPRVGCASNCTVATQADGSGLSDGADLENDDTLRARLDYRAANPPASGNDAEYQADISDTATLAVQQPFTWCAVNGPGSIGVTFTLRPSQPGANRIPNSTQLSLTLAAVGGLMPGDDGIYPIVQIAAPITIVLKVLWAKGAASWADTTQWPPYQASPNLVSAQTPAVGTPSPTFFRLDGTGITQPQAGQSIGFLDLPNLTFRRKKILTATADGSGGYDITVDTTNGTSDVSYTPFIGQPCCPWSDSLDDVLPALIAYFDTLGPGEMFASFFDAGLRQKRSPASPQLWPNQITNRVLGGAAAPVPPTGVPQNLPPVPTLLTTPSLQDVVLQEPTVPYSTPVGVPGVSVNILTLGAVAVFPE